MFGLDEKYIELLRNIFRKYEGIDEVILYGSRAKGNFTDRSDIDFAVKGDVDRYLISNIALDASDSDIPYKVDVQDYKQIGNFALKHHINRVGKVFYKREKQEFQDK